MLVSSSHRQSVLWNVCVETSCTLLNVGQHMDSIGESLEQSVAWLVFKVSTEQCLDNNWKFTVFPTSTILLKIFSLLYFDICCDNFPVHQGNMSILWVLHTKKKRAEDHKGMTVLGNESVAITLVISCRIVRALLIVCKPYGEVGVSYEKVLKN